jgi:TolA-binding protein
MQTAAKDPDSFVARGVRAYEQVRGLPYFQIAWRFRDKEYSAWWLYGNHQYDPAREIPGWEAFLREFSRHEAAGYAGYRLGRCYEITRQYDKALSTLWHTATVYPNAEMVYNARTRIVWILDAELDEPALRRLQVPELQGEIDYSIALHELRAGRYADAVRDLEAVIAHGAPTGADLPRLREQREQAARLAALAGKTDPQSRYDMAAIMYHNDIFSWAPVDPSAVQGDMDPAYARWEAASNHLIRAAEAFTVLEAAPGAVGEKAAYSRAMALIRLAESYDAGTALWKPRRAILAEAEALLTRFVAAHPKGDLTDDALLSLGFLNRDPAYFKRVRNEFPLSEVAATARSVNLKELPRAYPDREWVPFRYLTLEEAPPEVAAWARDMLAQGAHGQRTAGGVTYLVAGAPKPGLNGTLNLSDGTDGVIGSVQWQSFTPAEAYVLARVETSRPINFH